MKNSPGLSMFKHGHKGLDMFKPIKLVHGNRYKKMFASLKKVITFRSKSASAQEKHLYALSNYGFLIYDKAYRLNAYDVDYETVRNFAGKNRFLVRHLLEDYFKADLVPFELWMTAIPLAQSAKAARKNIFH
jgi:hypothetical protein